MAQLAAQNGEQQLDQDMYSWRVCSIIDDITWLRLLTSVYQILTKDTM